MANLLSKMKDNDLESVAGGAYTGSVFVYIVTAEDTISSLAQRFGTTVQTLSELNNIKMLEDFYPGLNMLIPLRG